MIRLNCSLVFYDYLFQFTYLQSIVMDRMKYLEEQLREASCLGDIESVCELVSKGIDINAQHEMNGW